ncbi:MAG: hypothetical protein QOI39_3016 [Mycobacterium sp.]|nr:hypothetical protein [Mycobacterium sp.]
MFCDTRHRMLASMGETDWSCRLETVTLLPADVEGSTRLWETQPDEMTVAVARLDQVLSDVVAAHDGVPDIGPQDFRTDWNHLAGTRHTSDMRSRGRDPTTPGRRGAHGVRPGMSPFAGLR